MALIISTIYIYCITITMLVVSDSFWNNLPTLITTTVAGLIALYGAIRANQAHNTGKENKDAILQTKEDLKKVGENVDGKMDKLLQAKDDVAKAEDEAVRIEEIKKASFDAGKLATMEQKEKEDALKKTPPPIQ